MDMVELSFPILAPPGRSVASDHAYALYGALCRLVPSLHEPACPTQVIGVSGLFIGNGKLELSSTSRLRMRTVAESIPQYLALAGRQLELAGETLRLGVPRVSLPTSPSLLTARLVTIKGFVDPDALLAAAVRQLTATGIQASLSLAHFESGPRAGEPRRRVLRIRDRRIVGFTLLADGLSPDDSLRLQIAGLGGRRKLGCGIFVPVRSVRS